MKYPHHTHILLPPLKLLASRPTTKTGCCIFLEGEIKEEEEEAEAEKWCKKWEEQKLT